MALELSITAELLKNQTNVKQQLIVEIENIPFVYGAVEVTKLAKYDDAIFYDDPGLVYDGITVDPNSKAYISLDGTTNNITQQLEIDKGGVGSIQKFKVALIDKNQEVTRAFQPDNYATDILGLEANVYIAFQGGAHPEDSVRIFNGIITSQEASPGMWVLGIDHPEFLKRQDLFPQVTTKLNGSINDTQTSLVLDTVSNLKIPQDALTSFILIDDELIQYTTITPSTNTLSGLTRGALGTIASSHSDDAESTSFYQLTGDPIDLALKLMLSNSGNTPFKENVSVPNFVQVDASQTINNGLFFPDTRLKETSGLELGDLVIVSGATDPANNFSDATIEAFISIPTGTVIVVSGPTLVIEANSSAVASFKSQYNTLSEGCSMKPSQVDVSQHLRMQTLFPNLPTLSPYIKDTINAKEFITEQIYFGAGFYQVPRKGRSSVNAIIPPLVLDELAELTDDNVKKIDKNKIKRQITKDFFNTVIYKFDEDTLEDKFLAGIIEVSQRSFNRIPSGTKSLTLEVGGFRDNPATRTFLTSQAKRFADRYQFAAESITIETNYKVGFPIEVTDIVLFGTSNLPDFAQGNRDFIPRLMLVSNKKLDIRGRVSLELLDVGFGLDGRYGVISPNSLIGSGATTTTIPLKASYGTGEFDIERDKWNNFIGEEIRVHNNDFTFDEVVELQQFDPSNRNNIIVSPPLSLAPSENYVIDLPDYPDSTDPEIRRKMKTIHCFHTPQVSITSGISITEFEVDAGDIGKFFVGAYVIIHNNDFTDSSTVDTTDDDLQVVSVDTGTNRVVVSGDMGFTPSAGYKVDLIGFKDEGLPYRLV